MSEAAAADVLRSVLRDDVRRGNGRAAHPVADRPVHGGGDVLAAPLEVFGQAGADAQRGGVEGRRAEQMVGMDMGDVDADRRLAGQISTSAASSRP